MLLISQFFFPLFRSRCVAVAAVVVVVVCKKQAKENDSSGPAEMHVTDQADSEMFSARKKCNYFEEAYLPYVKDTSLLTAIRTILFLWQTPHMMHLQEFQTHTMHLQCKRTTLNWHFSHTLVAIRRFRYNQIATLSCLYQSLETCIDWNKI